MQGIITMVTSLIGVRLSPLQPVLPGMGIITTVKARLTRTGMKCPVEMFPGTVVDPVLKNIREEPGNIRDISWDLRGSQ